MKNGKDETLPSVEKMKYGKVGNFSKENSKLEDSLKNLKFGISKKEKRES